MVRHWVVCALLVSASVVTPSAQALNVAVEQTHTDAAWTAQWTEPQGETNTGISGEGVAILEVEGFNMAHPDLDECGDQDHHSVTGVGGEPVNGPANSWHDSSGGHGNHIAGIICGSGEMSDGKFRGVSPRVSLFSHGCVPPSSCNISSWFTQNPLRVVTSSTTGDPVWQAERYGMPADVDVLFTQGAGNDGGTGEEARTPSFLEKRPRILAVAAANGYANDVADYSSRGDKENPSTWPDITAPGCMFSITPQGSSTDSQLIAVNNYLVGQAERAQDRNETACRDVPPTTFAQWWTVGYSLELGTSMASPFVAGVAALMFEVNPSLSALDAKFLLTRTADPFLPTNDTDKDGRITPEEFHAQHGYAAGWGLVNTTRAVAAAHYGLIHPNASVAEAVACSATGYDGESLVLNPDGGACPAGWIASQNTTADSEPAESPGKDAADGENESTPSVNVRKNPEPRSTPLGIGALIASLFVAATVLRSDKLGYPTLPGTLF